MEPQTDVIVAIETHREHFFVRKEGFTIDTTGKVPRVRHFKESLVRFASSLRDASLPLLLNE